MTQEWRCFHCDVVLTTHQDAELHFGRWPNAEPACAFQGRDQLLRTLRAAEIFGQEMYRQKTDYEKELATLRQRLFHSPNLDERIFS